MERSNEIDFHQLYQTATKTQIYEYQYLVRRLDIQFRYGCTNPACATELCFSYKMRQTHSAVHRPTALTSRIMAFYQATTRDVYSKLCPNPPVLLPQQLNIASSLLPLVKSYPVMHPSIKVGFVNREWRNDDQPPLDSKDGTQSSTGNGLTLRNYWQTSFPAVDRRSFAQKLFKTTAFQSFLWLELPLVGYNEMKHVLLPRNNHSLRTMSLESYSVCRAESKGQFLSFVDQPREMDSKVASELDLGPGSHPDFVDDAIFKANNVSTQCLRNVSDADLASVQSLVDKFVQDPAKAISDLVRSIDHGEDVDLSSYFQAFRQSVVRQALSSAFGRLVLLPAFFASRQDQARSLEYKRAIYTVLASILVLAGSIYPLEKEPFQPTWSKDFLDVVIHDRCYEDKTRASFHLFGAPKTTLSLTFEALDGMADPSLHRLAVQAIATIGAIRLLSESITSGDASSFRPFLQDLFDCLATVEHYMKPFDHELNDSFTMYYGRSVVVLLQAWLVRLIKRNSCENLILDRQSVCGIAIELLQNFTMYWTCRTRKAANPSMTYSVGSYLNVLVNTETANQVLDMSASSYRSSANHDHTLYHHQDDFVRHTLDTVSGNTPVHKSSWLLEFSHGEWCKDRTLMHSLSYPMLWCSARQINTFRALNYARMLEAYKQAGFMVSMCSRVCSIEPYFRLRGFVHERLRIARSRYLVLHVRRDHLLEDTFDQLWCREQRELMRPLKVRMGMDTGEAGVDQGGVSQEFFRLVFDKVYDPDAGFFTETEQGSDRYWFKPGSLEPSSTYQLLGLITALGVFNGLTLSVSFPLWFYKFLTGEDAFSGESARAWEHPESIRLDDIDDAWPKLACSFLKIHVMTRKQIGELCLDYTFSWSANGRHSHFDMETAARVEPNSSVQARAVTFESRLHYMRTYLNWLTKRSVERELMAFMAGFWTVLPKRILSVITAINLKHIMEGSGRVDMKLLEAKMVYEDGYDHNDAVIGNFWEVVHEYPAEKHAALLRFVMATDRLPVQGASRLNFAIVRAGPDSELLPTSSTCFRKLLLPAYATKEKLRTKLDLALEHSFGFGAA